VTDEENRYLAGWRAADREAAQQKLTPKEERERKLDEALRRLIDACETLTYPEAPQPTKADIERISIDVSTVLDAFARHRYGAPWITHTVRGNVRVNWRDVEGVIQEREFDTEAEARAFGATMTEEPLEFRTCWEMTMHHAGQLMKADPSLSPEEVMLKAGVRLEPAR
jgi:hypothetical protein